MTKDQKRELLVGLLDKFELDHTDGISIEKATAKLDRYFEKMQERGKSVTADLDKNERKFLADEMGISVQSKKAKEAEKAENERAEKARAERKAEAEKAEKKNKKIHKHEDEDEPKKAKKKPGTRREGSNQSVMNQLLTDGASPKKILATFAKIYDDKDEEFVAKRVAIYKKLGMRELGLNNKKADKPEKSKKAEKAEKVKKSRDDEDE